MTWLPSAMCTNAVKVLLVLNYINKFISAPNWAQNFNIYKNTHIFVFCRNSVATTT